MNRYKNKYLKYKIKYLKLKNMYGGEDICSTCPKVGFSNHLGECWNDTMMTLLCYTDGISNHIQDLFDNNDFNIDRCMSFNDTHDEYNYLLPLNIHNKNDIKFKRSAYRYISNMMHRYRNDKLELLINRQDSIDYSITCSESNYDIVNTNRHLIKPWDIDNNKHGGTYRNDMITTNIVNYFLMNYPPIFDEVDLSHSNICEYNRTQPFDISRNLYDSELIDYNKFIIYKFLNDPETYKYILKDLDIYNLTSDIIDTIICRIDNSKYLFFINMFHNMDESRLLEIRHRYFNSTYIPVKLGHTLPYNAKAFSVQSLPLEDICNAKPAIMMSQTPKYTIAQGFTDLKVEYDNYIKEYLKNKGVKKYKDGNDYIDTCIVDITWKLDRVRIEKIRDMVLRSNCITVSIFDEKSQAGHAIGFLKCNNRLYFYDDTLVSMKLHENFVRETDMDTNIGTYSNSRNVEEFDWRTYLLEKCDYLLRKNTLDETDYLVFSEFFKQRTDDSIYYHIKSFNFLELKSTLTSYYLYPMLLHQYTRYYKYTLYNEDSEKLYEKFNVDKFTDPIDRILGANLDRIYSKFDIDQINDKNIDKYSILTYAIDYARRSDDISLIRKVINQCNIDINIQEYCDGYYCLVNALPSVDTVKELLSIEGINVNIQSYRTEKSVLHHIIASYNIVPLPLERKKFIDIVNALLKTPTININIQDVKNRTPLFLAIEKNLYTMTMVLLSHHTIDVNIPDINDRTILHMAARIENERIIRELLKIESIDINRVDKYNRTPLHYAAMNPNVEVMNEILKHNIDVNIQDITGYTPLHYAMKNSNKNVALLLLDRPDIDVKIKNKSGHYPLYYSKNKKVWNRIIDLYALIDKRKHDELKKELLNTILRI